MLNPSLIVKRIEVGEFELWVVKKPPARTKKDASPVVRISAEDKMHTITEIIRKEAGVNSDDIFKKSKGKQHISDCRMICMYAIKYFLPETTYAQVGSYFNRDHATAMYAIKIITDRVSVNDPYVMPLIEKVIKSNIHAKV